MFVSKLRVSCLALLAGLLVVCLVPVAGASPLATDGSPGSVQEPVDRARYTVSPREDDSSSRIATLRNVGTSMIETGRSFVIARLTRDGWDRLRHSRNCAWPADARRIAPGDSYSQRVGVLGPRCHYKRLDPGTYRVVKWISFTDGLSGRSREDVVRARFEIIR